MVWRRYGAKPRRLPVGCGMKTGKPAQAMGPGGQQVRAYLDRETIDKARQLGNGNFSLGLRLAVKQTEDIDMIYVNAWFSPRGFANEGTNYYGTLAEWRAFVADADPHMSRWCISTQHRSLDAAQAAAEKEVRQSSKRIAWGEQDHTQAERLPALR